MRINLLGVGARPVGLLTVSEECLVLSGLGDTLAATERALVSLESLESRFVTGATLQTLLPLVESLEGRALTEVTSTLLLTNTGLESLDCTESVSLESFSASLKKLWTLILDGIKSIGLRFRDAVQKLWTLAPTLEKRVESLAERAGKIGSTEPARDSVSLGFEINQLTVSGAAPTSAKQLIAGLSRLTDVAETLDVKYNKSVQRSLNAAIHAASSMFSKTQAYDPTVLDSLWTAVQSIDLKALTAYCDRKPTAQQQQGDREDQRSTNLMGGKTLVIKPFPTRPTDGDDSAFWYDVRHSGGVLTATGGKEYSEGELTVFKPDELVTILSYCKRLLGFVQTKAGTRYYERMEALQKALANASDRVVYKVDDETANRKIAAQVRELTYFNQAYAMWIYTPETSLHAHIVSVVRTVTHVCKKVLVCYGA